MAPPPPRVITIWPHIHTSFAEWAAEREREEREREDKYLEGIKRAAKQDINFRAALFYAQDFCAKTKE